MGVPIVARSVVDVEAVRNRSSQRGRTCRRTTGRRSNPNPSQGCADCVLGSKLEYHKQLRWAFCAVRIFHQRHGFPPMSLIFLVARPNSCFLSRQEVLFSRYPNQGRLALRRQIARCCTSLGCRIKGIFSEDFYGYWHFFILFSFPASAPTRRTTINPSCLSCSRPSLVSPCSSIFFCHFSSAILFSSGVSGRPVNFSTSSIPMKSFSKSSRTSLKSRASLTGSSPSFFASASARATFSWVEVLYLSGSYS